MQAKPNIEMKKTYVTREGDTVRILAVDVKNENYPVIALITRKHPDGEEYEITEAFTKDGLYYSDDQNHRYDLEEYNPASKLVFDQPLWVRSRVEDAWNRRHFARFDDKGVWCFTHGSSSHTVLDAKHDVTMWKFWTDTNPE